MLSSLSKDLFRRKTYYTRYYGHGETKRQPNNQGTIINQGKAKGDQVGVLCPI